jgi:hypothetical protein
LKGAGTETDMVAFFFSVVGFEPRASTILSNALPIEPCPGPFVYILFLRPGVANFSWTDMEFIVLPSE